MHKIRPVNCVGKRKKQNGMKFKQKLLKKRKQNLKRERKLSKVLKKGQSTIKMQKGKNHLKTQEKKIVNVIMKKDTSLKDLECIQELLDSLDLNQEISPVKSRIFQSDESIKSKQVKTLFKSSKQVINSELLNSSNSSYYSTKKGLLNHVLKSNLNHFIEDQVEKKEKKRVYDNCLLIFNNFLDHLNDKRKLINSSTILVDKINFVVSREEIFSNEIEKFYKKYNLIKIAKRSHPPSLSAPL